MAPAGPVGRERLGAGLALLRSWGLDPIEGRGLYAADGYLAGSDAVRLADLQWAIDDPAIRAVIVARGGYGTQRIVDDLDLAGLRSDPKPIVGFSDLTALHLAVHRRAGVITFHGPGAAWNHRRTGPVAAEHLRRLLMGDEAPGTIAQPEGRPRLRSLAGGRADGVLAGGNLSLLAASVGTDDAPDLDGALVLLEDVGEPAYRIDRMLTHLLRAGLLAAVSGIVLAETEIVGDGPTFEDITFEDIAFERLSGLGVPILAGLAAGHGSDQLTLPLGARAVLDGTGLTVPDPVTSDI